VLSSPSLSSRSELSRGRRGPEGAFIQLSWSRAESIGPVLSGGVAVVDDPAGWRCLPTARLEESSDPNGCVFYFSGFDLVGPLGFDVKASTGGARKRNVITSTTFLSR
jgi:hypothetical protein